MPPRPDATGVSGTYRAWISAYPLFADAEVAENDVQDVLDVDPPGKPAERTGGKPQLLGQQILLGGNVRRLRPAQGGQGLLERMAVAFAGDQRGLGSG